MSKKNTRKKKTFQGNKKNSKDKTKDLIREHQTKKQIVVHSSSCKEVLPVVKTSSNTTEKSSGKIRTWLVKFFKFLSGTIIVALIGFVLNEQSNKNSLIREREEAERVAKLEQEKKEENLNKEIVSASANTIDSLLRVVEYIYDAPYLEDEKVFYISSNRLAEIWELKDKIKHLGNPSTGDTEPSLYDRRLGYHNFITTKIDQVVATTTAFVDNQHNYSFMEKYSFKKDTLFLTQEDKEDYLYYLYSEIFSIDLQTTVFAMIFGEEIPYKINNYRVFPKIKNYIKEIENSRGKDIFESYCEVCAIEVKEKPEGEAIELRMDDLPEEFLEKYNLQKYRE